MHREAPRPGRGAFARLIKSRVEHQFREVPSPRRTAGNRPATGNRESADPLGSTKMHDALQKEIATYEKRTPKSAAAHERALERIPLGVASNYRHYEPYPLFVKDGKGSRIHDLDG